MPKKKLQVNPVVQPENKLLPPLSDQEALGMARNLTTAVTPSYLEKDVIKVINKVRTLGENFKLEGNDADICSKYMAMNNLDNSFILAGCFDEKQQPFVVKMAADLMKEYDCKMPSEKALVQVAVMAFNRILKSSRAFNFNCFTDSISDLKNNFINIHSKELERANRQFLAAIQTLEQKKRPQIKFNVHADTAYLAQNQQINSSDRPTEPSNPPSNEKNDRQ